ncbi:TPA: hypothetical protein ACH3X3_007185 [Trebouxia sp. C0006]
MGSKSRGRGGGRASRGGRKGAPWAGAPVGGRRTRAENAGVSRYAQGESEDATLHIGGLRLQCEGDSVFEIAGNRRQKGKRPAYTTTQQLSSDDDSLDSKDSSDSDEIQEDYLANLQGSSDAMNSDDLQTVCILQEIEWLKQFTAANVGQQTAIDSMQEAAQGFAEALEECSTSSEDDSESYRETGSSDSESDVSIDDIITDLGGGLSLMEKYPVLLNEAPPGSNARGASSKPPKTRRGGAVRGASNGKLLPGEKKRLKKEKMNAKRAARSASHGLDLESVNAELVQFVATDGDMKGFPPMNKYGLQTVMKLASCYGLKSSAQGSGKKQFVVVASCERTCLPTGEAAAKVRSLLKEQNSFEAAMHVARMGSRTGSRPVRKSFGSGKQQQQPARFNQPISFVSSGVVGSDPMEIRPALQRVTQVIPDEAQPAEPSQTPNITEARQATLDAPWNRPEQQDGFSETARPGLGCSPLPDFEYPEDRTAGLGSQAEARPIYERLEGSVLGSAERDVAIAEPSKSEHDMQGAVQSGDVCADSGEDHVVPHGGYIYERRPGMPQSFMTKQDVKRARKNEQKLARRAEQKQMQHAGQILMPEPTSRATNLHYGKFEQHTTGYGSRMLARWGFSGQGAGLGRDQQGIAEPVAAFIRPKKVGLGHDSAH